MSGMETAFKAVLEHGEHHKKKLHVTGVVTEPTTGWHVHLERAEPQGINPEVLILKVNAVGPTGPAGDIVTKHSVHFNEDPAKVHYKEVMIEDGSKSLTIPVHSH